MSHADVPSHGIIFHVICRYVLSHNIFHVMSRRVPSHGIIFHVTCRYVLSHDNIFYGIIFHVTCRYVLPHDKKIHITVRCVLSYNIFHVTCRYVLSHDNILHVTFRSGYRWLASWRWVWLSWSPSVCLRQLALNTDLSRVFSLSSCSVRSDLIAISVPFSLLLLLSLVKNKYIGVGQRGWIGNWLLTPTQPWRLCQDDSKPGAQCLSSNDSFNFPLGLIKYVVVVVAVVGYKYGHVHLPCMHVSGWTTQLRSCVNKKRLRISTLYARIGWTTELRNSAKRKRSRTSTLYAHIGWTTELRKCVKRKRSRTSTLYARIGWTTELRNCVNREVVGLVSHSVSHSSPSLIGLTVYVGVKHHERRRGFHAELRSCLNREVGLGPHFLSHSSPVPNKPYCFCARKAP